MPFSRASGFGVNKASGAPVPPPRARRPVRHPRHPARGRLAGVTVFDCFGAGQQVSQVTYGGVSWREHDDLGEMAAVLSVMRQLHEMLAHLDRGRAAARPGVPRRPPRPARRAARRRRRTSCWPSTSTSCATRSATCWRGQRARAGRWAGRIDLARRRPGRQGPARHRPARRGAARRPADRRRPARRGPHRGRPARRGRARHRRARRDLAGALFLTQPQLNAMRGDAATRLPGGLARPGHWA